MSTKKITEKKSWKEKNSKQVTVDVDSMVLIHKLGKIKPNTRSWNKIIDDHYSLRPRVAEKFKKAFKPVQDVRTLTRDAKILKWIEKEIKKIEDSLVKKYPEDLSWNNYEEGRFVALMDIKQRFYEK